MDNSVEKTIQEMEDQPATTKTVTLHVTPEHLALIGSAQEKLNLALNFVVDSKESFELAAICLQDTKGRYKELDETRKSITKPMDLAKKGIMDLFRSPLSFLTQAEGALKRSMISYQQAEERKRQIGEAKRQEVARKEEERLRKRAEKAALKGKTEKAEMLEQQADAVPMPIVTYEKPQTTGISTRKTWYAEVTDADELLKGILDGVVPRTALTINMQFLNGQARALKKELNYPGVVARFKEDIAARSS